jgi:hypothetical protein
VFAEFRNQPGREIECENFREFFYPERAGSHGNALEQAMGIFPV